MKFYILAALLTLFLNSQPAAAETKKSEAVAVALKALDEVYALRNKYGSDMKYDADHRYGIATFRRFDKKLNAYLQTIKDPSALREISVLCYYVAFPGVAGDNDVDDYFDRCQESAMFRLADIKGREAQEQLMNIGRYIGLDGGIGERFDDAVEIQNKLNGLPPPKRPVNPNASYLPDPK